MNSLEGEIQKLVRKRDGTVVPYDRRKIENAVGKAFRALGLNPAHARIIAKYVELELYTQFFKKHSIPSVEEIQDIVEMVLMQNGYIEVAKAYIIYREKRRETREIAKALIDGENLIDEYIQQKDWRVRENSNMSYSLQGLNFYISSSVVARYWLNKLYPPRIKNAHDAGDVHIHDLGILGPYCVGWDMEELILNGFQGVAGKIESRPAKHLRSILGQVVNFIYTLQGEAAGAQAFSNFDTYLAPYVREDNLSYEEVKQALQEFLFNINIPTRVGFQTPFSNITMDAGIPRNFIHKPVVHGGRYLSYTYKELEEEIKIVNRAFAELMLEGDAKQRPFTFPIPTYNISKDFKWDDEALNPLWELTAKYGTPYFANFVNSNMEPEDVRSMCCRLRLDNRELKRRGGGLFGANPLTGSIGVVTINLPRIGYLSRNEEEFFTLLEERIEIAKESLEIKRKVLEHFTEKGLYPYSKVYLEKIKKEKGGYWANHFSTIGIIGANEALLNFAGVSIKDKNAKKFIVKVLWFLREKLKKFQDETGNLYNLEATPAEGASYRLAKKDKERFGDIITQGTEDTPYYTNSVHIPVNEQSDIFETLSHQDELQVLFTGGTVVHIFVGERIHSPEIVKVLVKKIVSNFRVPYFTITPTFSICPVHGYIPGEHFYCPKEHTEEEIRKYGKNGKIPAEVYSRIVGYYRPVSSWNRGKRQEFKDRKYFKICL